MSSISILKAAGIYRSSNELGSVPDGAMTEAKNVVIRSKDVVEPRRGVTAANAAGAFQAAVRSLHAYNGSLYAVGGTGTLSDGVIAKYDGSSSLTALVTAFNAPDSSNIRTRSVEAQNCLYLTASDGIRKLDSTTSDHVAAATPIPLPFRSVSGTVSTGGAGAVNWLAQNSLVGYVHTFNTRDATGRFIEGEPSPVGYAGSDTTASAFTPSVSVALPTGITTSHYIKLYRTRAVDVTDTPDADYYLVAEIPVTSAALALGYASYTDQTPEDAIGTLAYFSANAEGLAGANNEPPLAVDAVLFGNRVLYANTTLRHSFSFEVLATNGTGSTSGALKPGDKITIAGMVYEAVASGVAISGTDGKFTCLSPTADFSPADSYSATLYTVENLCRAINQDTRVGSGQVYACPIPDMLRANSPGGLNVFRRTLTQGVFYLTASNSTGATALTCFSPTLPLSGTTAYSDNEAGPNRIYWSKRDIPEAVPRLDYLTVGAKNKKILRSVVVRDRCFIFKEDGIFTLSGQAPRYQVYALDPTVRLLAPDSVSVVNNEVYALTNKGVVKVNDAGVQIVSKGIEREIALYINDASSSTNVYTGTWSCAYETENLYLLGIASESEYECDKIYCYNTSSGAWTWWDIQARCGFVEPVSNKLYLGGDENANLLVERKSLTNADFQDGTPRTGVEIGGVTDLGDGTYSVNFSASDFTGNETVISFDGSKVGRVITSAVGNDAVVRMAASSEPFVSGESVNLHEAYECIAQWAAKPPGGPGSEAQVRNLDLVFREANFTEAEAGLSTDACWNVATLKVNAHDNSGGGSADWGADWMPTHKQVGVASEVARGRYFRVTFLIKEALAMWALMGITLTGTATGNRSK